MAIFVREIRFILFYHKRWKLSKTIFLIFCIILTIVCCHVFIIIDAGYYSEDGHHYIYLKNTIFENDDYFDNHSISKMPDLGIFLNSKIFRTQEINLSWIRQRIARLNRDWSSAFEHIKDLPHFILSERRNILIFPGLVSEYSVYNFAENAFKGGYLGELIQWSDLIAGLYTLGHRLSIVTSKSDIKEISNAAENYDIVFTDYIGLIVFREEDIFVRYKCKIRVLDVYGTEPKFNFRTVDFNSFEPYAKWNFEDTRQFYTFYPDTHDNTFLGFVIQNSKSEITKAKVSDDTTMPIAVIYGKNPHSIYSIKNNIRLIQLVSELFEVHSTFRGVQPDLPNQVINHGILPANEISALLNRAKLFVGMGYPYDGPGPFEALAEGTIFLQSKFLDPKSRENDKFFTGKPTSRSITSQHMYLERYVGEPYVYTIDTSNTTLVRETLLKILKAKPLKPFVPFEFTATGFLERLALLVDQQNFCDGPNVALKKRVNSSPHFENNIADFITNGQMDKLFCFVSKSVDKPWIEIDLDTEIWINKIRITLSTDWASALEVNSFNAFKVTLLDFTKRIYASKKFFDGRIFHVWDDINIPARYIHIEPVEYLNNHFMICDVEVFQKKRRKLWPDRRQIEIKSSLVGKSCKDTCAKFGLFCERSFFPMINNLEKMKEYLNCSISSGLDSHVPDFVDYSPAQYVTNTGALGMCITNNEPMLFSCAGNYPSAIRVCPCIKTMSDQNGLPVY